MSILFRTKGWLTLAQLVRAWAPELPGAKTAPSQVERDLGHLLLEDMINGRLDESGPLVDGRRLGLRLITPEGRAGFLEGHQVHELTVDGAYTPAAASFIWNRLLVVKEAVFDFARRHELPAPSWWADVTIAPREQIDAAPSNEGRESKTYDELAAEQEARGLVPPGLKAFLERTDRSAPAAPNPAPILPQSSPETPVDLTNAAPRRAQKGPAPGTVDRFGESDRAPFPEIERIMREGRKSVHAAALEVPSAGKVQGGGTPESRAKRLTDRFRKENPRTATR